MAQYAVAAKEPTSWNQVKAHVQAAGGILANIQLAQTIARERGRLLTREEVEKREEEADELILGRLSAFADFAQELVPADQRPAVRAKAMEWIARIRGEIADALEGMRE